MDLFNRNEKTQLKVKKVNKKEDSPLIHLYLESFIDNNHKFVSVQILIQDSLYFYHKKKDWSNPLDHKKNGLNIYFIPWNFEKKQTYIIDDVIQKAFLKEKQPIQIHFYNQITNLYALFSFEKLEPLFSTTLKGKGCLFQKNGIHGHFYWNQSKITFFDLAGWAIKQSEPIDTLLDVVGYSNPYHGMEEKGFMEEETSFLIEYGIEKVVQLKELKMRMLHQMNQLFTQTFDFPENFLFTEETLPSSMGGIVANLLEKFFYFCFSKNKMGIFDPILFEKFDRLNINLGLNKRQVPKKYNYEKRRRLNNQTRELKNVLTAGSGQNIAKLHIHTSGVFSALIHGGRTSNEQPYRNLFERLADFDLKGCYGEALRGLECPVGNPTIIANTIQDQSISLKEFLKEYKDELMDNLYTIVIEKKVLHFDQDLLYSKLITQSELTKRIISKTSNEEVIKTNSEFALLKNSLLNTVITSDILNALQKICTNKELSEIYESEVVSAAFYSKSKFIDQESFVSVFTDEKEKMGSYSYKSKKQFLEDTRSRKWTTINLSLLMNPLLTERKKYKAKMNQSQNETDKIFYKNKQLFYKRIINTIYGVFASVYYSVSNSVLANVITARARLNTWMATKTLLGIQTITDGFAYQPEKIVEIKDKHPLPGLNTLAQLNKNPQETIKKNRALSFSTLGNKSKEEWINIYEMKKEEEFQQFDQYASIAIQNFWKPYGLSLAYEIEHKIEHTGLKSIHLMKAHYAIITMKGEVIYRFRGMDMEEDSFYKRIVESYLLNKNKWVTEKEWKDLLIHKKKSTQTIYEYIIEKKNKNDELIIKPGENKMRHQTLTLKINQGLFKNKKTYKEVQKTTFNIEDILKESQDKENELINIITFFEMYVKKTNQKWNELER